MGDLPVITIEQAFIVLNSLDGFVLAGSGIPCKRYARHLGFPGREIASAIRLRETERIHAGNWRDPLYPGASS